MSSTLRGMLMNAAVVLAIVPAAALAQSGKWKGVISQLGTVRGNVELNVEPFRNESRAKLAVRASSGDKQIAWDIAEGRCGTEGASVDAAAAFPQITTRLDGSGEATTRIKKLESGKQYYLRVYDPKKQLTDNAAYGCANISEVP